MQFRQKLTSKLITVTVDSETATFNVSIIETSTDINSDGKVDINDLRLLELLNHLSMYKYFKFGNSTNIKYLTINI